MDGPKPTSSFDDFLRQEEEFRGRAERLHATNKSALMTALSSAGVTVVTVSFDGYGDDGRIQSIRAVAGEVEVDLPTTPLEVQVTHYHSEAVSSEVRPLPEAIEALVYGFLRETHMGWENNEGAFGELIILVAEASIRLEFNERFVETEYHEHEF